MKKPAIRELPLAELRAQPINAHFMQGETYTNLVKNLRRDGVLTSTPLVRLEDDGGHRILSGHHRVRAAIDAGITHGDCQVIEEPMSRQQEVALVLSHNAIFGDDDPATLKQLYEELEDPDWRWYSGLDDRTLDLLEKVSTTGLSEANLEFSTVSLVFLPHEKEAAKEALEEARKASAGDEVWIAPVKQYEPVLAALETVHNAHGVGNVATAFQVILGVFEAHLADLQSAWVLPDGEPRKKKPVPMETVFGSRLAPSSVAAVLLRAFRDAVKNGDAVEGDVWGFFEMLAADYVAVRNLS